ncbi:hypothetical protein S40293_10507 [Stachybotrys chartarum IBT 40293]|nr:hypothetical protein S40293_10507 [Stachybotrys chartarum IBT 40293]
MSFSTLRNEDSELGSAQNPYCLGTQGAYCVLCRYPIWVISGDWSSSEFQGYCFGFRQPATGYKWTPHRLITMYHKKGLYQCRACSDPTCSLPRLDQDVIFYHVDCSHMVSQTGTQLQLHDIWQMGIWTRPLRDARYHDWPQDEAGVLEDIGQGHGFLTSLSLLPREVRAMITAKAPNARYWRLLYARRRWWYFSHYLCANKSPQLEYPFSQVTEWSRKGGVVKGDARTGKVRIRLDAFGAVRLEFVDQDELPVHVEPFTQNWYIMEDLGALRDSRILIKGRCLRIKTDLRLQIWDKPSRPYTRLRWQGTKAPLLLQTILLQGLTGLTVFCRNGTCYWVHPHYGAAGFQDAPLPPQLEYYHPVERQALTPIFFPLADGETLISMFSRFRYNAGLDSPKTLVVSPARSSKSPCVDVPNTNEMGTSCGRTLHFGEPQTLRGPADLKQLVASPPQQIVLSYGDLYFSNLDYAPVLPVVRPARANHVLLPTNLCRTLPLPPSLGPHYVSVAPIHNLKQIRLFYRRRQQRPSWQCVGMLMEYLDGAFESLGSCYGRSTCQLIKPLDMIHSRRAEVLEGFNGQLDVFLSRSENRDFEFTQANLGAILALGHNGCEANLVWWFNENGPVDVRVV